MMVFGLSGPPPLERPPPPLELPGKSWHLIMTLLEDPVSFDALVPPLCSEHYVGC